MEEGNPITDYNKNPNKITDVCGTGTGGEEVRLYLHLQYIHGMSQSF